MQTYYTRTSKYLLAIFQKIESFAGMKLRSAKLQWVLTPYFFERAEPELRSAIPEGADIEENDPNIAFERTPEGISAIHLGIHRAVAKNLAAGSLSVSVAGDCMTSLPVMAAAQQFGIEPILVWLDAHGDFNTPETSPKGFLGGMPLAMMVGRGDMAFADICGLKPVREEDVFLVGARDLDRLEHPALEKSGVTQIDLEAMKGLQLQRPVHLHIDNDVVNPLDTPANNYVSEGGPRLGEVIEACVKFASQNTICAISFSGWNGSMDEDGATAQACACLLQETAYAAAAGTDFQDPL